MPALPPELTTLLSPVEQTAFAQACQQQSCSRGTVLIAAGSIAKDLYFLQTGRVKIYQLAQLAQQNCVLEMGDIPAPTVLGEANLFRQQERAASVLSSEDCTYLKLSSDDFEKLKADHPQLAIKLLGFAGAIVSERLLNVQNTLHTRLVENAVDVPHALSNLQRYTMSGIKLCPPELAEKLFDLS